MQVKQIAAGIAVAGVMGIGGLALAGTASASNDNWTPGQGGWQPGAGLATFSANVKVANGNFNNTLSSNKILSGNFNGNTFNIASGNTVKLNVGNGNIFNSGADSFNTTTIKNSYNTLISGGNKYTPPKH